MKQSKKLSELSYITTGQAASHCQVSIPTFRRWIGDGRLVAFKTLGRHCRIPVDEFQRFLRQHGMPPYPVPAPATRILIIVDDETQIVNLLAEFLAANAQAFRIETATDGYEALLKVGAFKPSVLILDVAIPLLDGIEVCRRLKANPETRAIKILGVTGYPDSVPALMKSGADACLTKPLDPGRVKQEVERLLAR